MLTKDERKKLRKKSRIEAQREKQERILLGLETPPPPKIKISNMYRVLTSEAVADPSAIEKKVRQEMEQRLSNHDARNEARKLTPEEKHEKKVRKYTEDTTGEVHIALFKISDLTSPQIRFKVDINAQHNHLTGCILYCGDVTMVVVEGGVKGIKRYKKLMLQRINWSSMPTTEKEEKLKEEKLKEEKGQTEPPKKSGWCALVWEGITARPSFKNFRIENRFENEAQARKFLQDRGIGHYYDFAKQYSPQGGTPFQPPNGEEAPKTS